jgi:inhibitor of growth protein 4
LALCDKKVSLATTGNQIFLSFFLSFSSLLFSSLLFSSLLFSSLAYASLDDHIRKLDADLRRFEAELEQKELTLTAAERRKRKAVSGLSAAEQRKLVAADPAGRGERRRGGGVGVGGGGVARTFDVAVDMPIDPNEPTYCICQRVSFGEMVGCDNPECRREWFHFECVGLSATPGGRWLCPECSALRRTHN